MKSHSTTQPIKNFALTGLAAALALILAMACVMPPAAEVISDTFTVSDPGMLVIDIPNGFVELKGIDEATEIKIVAEVQDPSHWRYSAKQTRGMIEVTAKKKGLGWSTRDKVYLKVSLPTKFQMNVRTSNGDINARNVTGNSVIRSSNGKITVAAVQGEFDLKPGNGNISFGGELIPQSENEFFVGNGSITVELAGESPNVRIQADVGNGNIYLEHPVTSMENLNQKRLDVIVGSGTANLNLGAGNGSIRIE